MANSKSLKYNLTFWQLFIILVVATALGTLVAYYAYGNMVQDDANSVWFPHSLRGKTTTKMPVKKSGTTYYRK